MGKKNSPPAKTKKPDPKDAKKAPAPEKDIDDSFNDKSNTQVWQGVGESFNDNSTNDSNNDNSTSVDITTDLELNKNVGNDYSNNQDFSKDIDIDVKVEDSFNDNSNKELYLNSFNDNSQSLDIDVDVKAKDSFNNVADSYNSVSTDLSKSWGGVNVNFDNVLNGAYGGKGSADNASTFAVNQVNDLVDNDVLSKFSYSPGGTVEFHANGGGAYLGTDDWKKIDDAFSAHGGSNVIATADASAYNSGSAFNMDVVLGANMQQNAVLANIAGGDQTTTETTGDSF